MRQVYLGADHRGYHLKEEIKEELRDLGWAVTDLGNKKYDIEDDYTDIAIELAEKVVQDKSLGILICGSGVGVCIAANKVRGIRAATCLNKQQSRKAKEDDDVNILCLSADWVDKRLNLKIVKEFLEAVFSSEERHIERILKIKKYETANIS
ncbi:MAG: RpiB/LacA/LacB family sugar-phosphate isomerase [Candidatus Shapirobacteria bacterium]|jgi:ribose 5-phosphate isomerase B